MDLTKINVVADAEQGGVCHLRDPYTGEDLDCSITLLGRDSAIYKNHAKKVFSKKNQNQDFERHIIDLLAVSTVDWTNITEGGDEIECSFQNAKRIYKDHPWIREQLIEFQEDRANFLSR